MKIRSSKAVSTTIAAIIIIVIVIAAAAAIYVESQNVQTTTATSVSTSTATSVSTSTATSVSTSTATSVSTSTATSVSTSTATSVSTSTATSVSTSTATSVSTSTTTSTITTSSGGSIPPNTIVEGILSPQWGSSNIGIDAQLDWAGSTGFFNQMYEQLVQYDPAGLQNNQYNLIPWLASSYTVSADGLTYTFTLRQGVHFHTGNVMSARDVQYSIDRAQFFNDFPASASYPANQGAGLIYRDTYASFKNVSVVSPTVVTLTLKYQDPLVLSELSNQVFSIVDRQTLEAHAVTTSNSSDHGWAWATTGQNGDVGTGPFTITSYTPMQRAEMAKFSNYWGGPNSLNTSIQKIIVLPIADATAARFALEKGQINMLAEATDQELNAIAAEPGFSTLHAPGFLNMNLYMHPVGPLADWRVRKALKSVIDYNGIRDALTFGLDYVDQSEFFIGMQGFQNSTATYYSSQGINITGAKALLAQAGYPNGFTINLYTRPHSRYGITFVDLASVLRDNFAQIGVNLVINVYVVGQFYNLAQNMSLPGIWTVPGSLLTLSPESNFQGVLGGGNTLFIGWSASAEKGPNVNFNGTTGNPYTLLYNEYNTSLRQINPQTQIQEEQALALGFVKWGTVDPILQISTKVAFTSNIKGVTWNSFLDGLDITYLTTS